MRLAALELDLDVFAGPFDLLLTLILREEIDLLEVDLAEVVISYVDHLERSGQLDLDAATEFLVLIAALLELKSRLLLPDQDEELIELDPSEAADELLARLLDAHRYRGIAGHLVTRLAEESGHRFRSAPLPTFLRRATLEDARAVYEPTRLAAALGDLLRLPPAVDVRHMRAPKVSVGERLTHLRQLLRRGSFTFDEAVASADRVTIAVTLFALLELYKQGELTWVQEQPFAEIRITPRMAGAGAGAEPWPEAEGSPQAAESLGPQPSPPADGAVAVGGAR